MQVAILLFDGITALDAVGPYEVLSKRPLPTEIVFVGKEAGPKKADSGALTLMADASLSDVPKPDILLLPGGPGNRGLLADRELLDWIRQAHETSTWTTSVCTGALLLGAAGILNGLEATTHWLSLDQLSTYGARPVQRRVVELGKVITCAGVSAGIDMALVLAARIAGDEVAQRIQLAIEYDPQPPFDTGSPLKAPAEMVDRVRQRAAAALRSSAP